MSVSDSSARESWISSFCSLLGHEYFAEVSEEFIEDDFNLTGLQGQVPMYKEALEVCDLVTARLRLASLLYTGALTLDADMPDAVVKLILTPIPPQMILDVEPEDSSGSEASGTQSDPSSLANSPTTDRKSVV